MAGSPFAVFRRNQRQLMVVLTGLAMFAFIFMDAVSNQSGQMPRSFGVVFIALLCGGGLWVIGSPRGKGTELALYGALIGGVIAFFGLRAAGPPPVAVTSIGSFTREDLQRAAQRRGFANRFVAAVSRGMRSSFGATDDESLVQRAILLHEAKQRRIEVSNEAVNEYIETITDGGLDGDEFKKILRDMGIQEPELFEILREELEVQLALKMDLPPALPTGMALIETPLTYWKQYKMLQVRESLDVAAIPVEPFVAQIPEPNDVELQQFFDRYKSQLPTPSGEPGFLQDRKVNLAYVAADFETFENMASAPSDAEIVAYYEANKERYPALDIPESTGMLPDSAGDESPASALQPANLTAPELPDIEGSKTPPAPALPENGEAAASRRPGAVPVQLVSLLQDDTSADSAVPTTNAETSPAAPATPDSPKSDETELPKLELPPPAAAELPPAPATPPAKKYRALDDGLKLEISETILRDRAFDAMGEAVDRAYNEMTKLADNYLGAFEEAEQETIAADITKKLKAYAELNHLVYAETGLVTRNELIASLEHQIGMAAEPTANPFQRGTAVAERAFDNDAVYYPARADSPLRDKRYAYWKLEDAPPRVPELKEVKPQVVQAWKLDKARPLAKQRAAALAELVQNSAKPMSDALSGQTITGETNSEPVSTRSTPQFSWMSMPRNLPFQFNPMYMPPPELSRVDGVSQPGVDFMRTVFDELGPGQTGVAVNEPKSVYYVAQVKQRDASPSAEGDNLGLKALQQQFLLEGRQDQQGFSFNQGAYMYLGRDQLIEMLNAWRKGYEKEYQVVWADSLAMDQPVPE